ncbi:MAG TPA: alpha/beta fold hydrolase [Marmoricola sp.]|nr:alpha/beta fold hydrolase [Marmoricola sp.]
MTAPGAPSLRRRDPDGTTRGVVLMLHGGAVSGSRPVDRRSGAYQRSGVMRNSIAQSLLAQGWAVDLLRFSVKGWNESLGSMPAPVRDTRWALNQIRSLYGDLPVVLVGHSMGGRTALNVGDDPSVAGVVALAPWCERTDPVEALQGKPLIALHGQLDKVTNPKYTKKMVERAQAAGVDARFVDMGPVGHYMIRQAGHWNQQTIRAVQDVIAAL